MRNTRPWPTANGNADAGFAQRRNTAPPAESSPPSPRPSSAGTTRRRTADQPAVTVRGFAADILPFIAAGRIRPLIDRVFPFSELPAAKDYMESNAHLGKIAVTVP